MPSVETRTHASALGSYRPPTADVELCGIPPQMIISFPVQTAECPGPAFGAPVALIGNHESEAGEYRPPTNFAPQIIICVPDHTAVCSVVVRGARFVEVGSQVLKFGK